MKEKNLVMAPICFLLVIGICLFIGNYLTTGEYNELVRSIHYHDTYYSEKICQYKECENKAEREIELTVNELSPGFGRVLGIKNEADFNVKTDSFSYTPTEKHVSVDRGTYLVPQGDGSLKVEKRTYLNEYETKGKTATYSYVDINGLYCEEHSEIAEKTLKQELKSVMVDKNPIHLVLMIILPLVVAIIGICVEVKIAKSN